MNDNILLGFLVSIIIGIIGIIPSCILRFGFKVKFGRKKAAFVMIPIAILSIGLLTCLFYALGFEIKEFSLISLFIICLGTFQIICKEYDFETSNNNSNDEYLQRNKYTSYLDYLAAKENKNCINSNYNNKFDNEGVQNKQYYNESDNEFDDAGILENIIDIFDNVKKVPINNYTILGFVAFCFLSFVIIFQPSEYGFYQVLRWLVCSFAAWTSVNIYQKTPKSFWLMTFIALAIIFNPVLPLKFDEEIWVPIDIVTAMIFIVYAIKCTRKNKTDNSLVADKISNKTFQNKNVDKKRKIIIELFRKSALLVKNNNYGDSSKEIAVYTAELVFHIFSLWLINFTKKFKTKAASDDFICGSDFNIYIEYITEILNSLIKDCLNKKSLDQQAVKDIIFSRVSIIESEQDFEIRNANFISLCDIALNEEDDYIFWRGHSSELPLGFGNPLNMLVLASAYKIGIVDEFLEKLNISDS